MFGGNAAPAAAAAPADDMFGGDDLMGSSAPAPSANDMDDMFGSAPAEAAAEAPAAVPSMFAPEPVAHEDNSLIEEWERKKREQLQQRREESAKKKSVAMEAGKTALEQFESKRKTEVEQAQSKNKTDEKDTIASMEAALKAGLVGKESWEKVTTYIDLSSDPKRNNTISRIKSVLIAIKTTPPSEKKNFGA